MEDQLKVWGWILLLSAVELVIGVRLILILLAKLSYRDA